MRNHYGLSARALCAGVGMALACCTAAHAQVADDCSLAGNIGAVSTTPIFVSGSTVGATNDAAIFGFCGTSNDAAGDVFFIVAGTGNRITVSLCPADGGSAGYDSKLAVYQGDCFSPICVVGNDDFCGLQSRVEFCSDLGVDYIVMVHGWSSSTGAFTAAVFDDGVNCSEPGACCFGDGSCIEVNSDACNSAGGFYQGPGTDCGSTFCPDLSGACCFIDGSCIQAEEGPCNSSGGIFQGAGTDCGSVFCPDLSPTNNECVDAIALTINGSTSSGNTSLATPSVLPTDCGTTGGTTSPGVWYSVIGDGTTLTASTCNPGSSYDTRLRVFQGADCSFTNCIGQNDDMGSGLCPQSGLLSRIVWCSLPGETYYIYVHGFGLTSAGAYEVGVTSDGIDCATPGACCFGDGSCIEVNSGDCSAAGGTFQGAGTDCGSTFCPDLSGACCFLDGSCVQVLEAACNSSGGIFQGSGTDCGSTFCPDLSPDNNECVDAIALTIDGSTETGNTGLATPSVLNSNCGATSGTASPGVWYSVIGNGTTLTATTCHPGTTFDSYMFVFEGADCASAICVGFNDDGSPGGGSDPACHSTGIGVNRASTVIWCSIPGQTYYIYVSGFSTASGNYEIGVTSDGLNCADPGACCFDDGSCIDTIADSCASAGGVFQGGGTTCGTTTCPDLRIGACCLPGDTCIEVTAFDCSISGGSFQGPNTICDPAFANSSFPNVAIPDNSPAGITDSIVVASSAAITSIEVSLDITHTWVGDLLITLDRDGIEQATLVGRPGVPSLSVVGFSSDLDGVYILSDSGAVSIADAAFSGAGAIPPGTYQASDSDDLPVSLNSSFTNTQGTWTLFISDNAGLDLGTIRGWGIGFNGEVPVTICSTGPAPCPCDFNGNGLQEIGDYFSFLTAFFAQLGGPGSADFDGDGTVTIGDYFAFLACLPDIAASTACP